MPKTWRNRLDAPTEEELEEISLSPLYVYYGDCEGRSREGEGVWYILDPDSRDYEAHTYDWENDQPVGGFEQEPVPAAQPATGGATASSQWVTVQTSDSPEAYPGNSRVTTITYAIGANTFRFHEVWTRPDGSTDVTSDASFVATQPVQRFDSLGNGSGVLYFPTGTVVTNARGYQWTVQAGQHYFEMAGGIGGYVLYLSGT